MVGSKNFSRIQLFLNFRIFLLFGTVHFQKISTNAIHKFINRGQMQHLKCWGGGGIVGFCEVLLDCDWVR